MLILNDAPQGYFLRAILNVELNFGKTCIDKSNTVGYNNQRYEE